MDGVAYYGFDSPSKPATISEMVTDQLKSPTDLTDQSKSSNINKANLPLPGGQLEITSPGGELEVSSPARPNSLVIDPNLESIDTKCVSFTLNTDSPNSNFLDPDEVRSFY